MLRPLMIAALGLAAAIALSARAADSDDGLPDDPAKALIVGACTTCHDVGLITLKPRAPDEWETVVGKMVDRGASLSDADRQQVVAYLVKNFGPKPDTATAPSAANSTSPGR